MKFLDFQYVIMNFLDFVSLYKFKGHYLCITPKILYNV